MLKRLITKTVWLLLLVCYSVQADATHLVGGYMNYEFIGKVNGNSRYKVTLNAFRDCLGDVEFDDFITIGVYLNDNDRNIYKSFNLGKVIKSKVDPPGNLDCDFWKKRICIEYGFYEGIITLPPYSEGYHITWAKCCRNFQKNIVEGDQPTQGQTYYCFIPNTALENSSPAFYGVPSPYMCSKDTNSFLFDAVDRDGDSLVYQLMRPYSGASLAASTPPPPNNLETPLLRYKPGFSATSPFGADGYASVDRGTGHTQLYSNNTGNYVVGVEVLEYRNGEQIGRVRMDLQILVMDCSPNETPDIGSNDGNRFEILAGTELCFDVFGSDKDGDLLKLRGRGDVLDEFGEMSGNLAIFRDTFGFGAVSQEFCWTPACDADRVNPYYVYFTVEDDGCPPKFNNLDVEIIVKPFEGAKILVGPEEICRYSEHEYRVIDFEENSTYEWEITKGEIVGQDNVANIIVSWTGIGAAKIRVREVSPLGCLGEWIEKDILVIESPPLPIITGKDTVCVDETGLRYRSTANADYTYLWEAKNATIGIENNEEIELVNFALPTFNVRLAVRNRLGCLSDTADVEVYVSVPSPIIEGPQSVCPNAQGIEYIVENGVNGSVYTWVIIGGVQVSGANTSKITVNWGDEGVGRVEVVERNRFGCISPNIFTMVEKTYDFRTDPIDGPQQICEFETGIAYSVIPSNGSVYDWTIVRGNQTSGDSSAAIKVDWASAGLGKVTVQQRAYDAVNDRYCLSSVDELDVLIHPNPVADQIVGTMELCQFEDSVSYTIDGYAGSTYDWAIDGNRDDVSGQGTNTITMKWDVAGSFSINVIETTIFGCVGNIVDTVVLVNPKPQTSPIDGPTIICPENTNGLTYSVTGFNTSTYQWQIGGNNNTIVNGFPAVIVDWEPTLPAGKMSVLEISDKGCLGDTQKLDVTIDRLAIELRVVSVGTPDDRIHINWQLQDKAVTDKFLIQKRIAQTTNWQNVATVDGSVFEYLETDINTDANAFEYRVTAVNMCGTDIYSDVHTSILLKGYQDEDFNSIMNFSDYMGWKNGVSIYDLFVADNRSAYSMEATGVIAQVPVIIESSPEQFRLCYRVRAQENLGNGTESWSNEICFYYSPKLFVPNAFTANNDNLNDGFGIQGIAINEFNIKIYNRWGEKLYESTDIDEKWIPIYKGEDVQMGTYIYLITYTDFENSVFNKSGTINLLR